MTVPADNADSWGCYILHKQFQALCVARGGHFAGRLPLGLGRCTFPDFFRVDNTNLPAGFS